MHPRGSIPNVGRRAHGRKALFLLKGNSIDSKGVKSSAPVIGSLSEDDNGEYYIGDQSADRPTHPYNNILQRILRRHHEARADKDGIILPHPVHGEKVTQKGSTEHHGDTVHVDGKHARNEGQQKLGVKQTDSFHRDKAKHLSDKEQEKIRTRRSTSKHINTHHVDHVQDHLRGHINRESHRTFKHGADVDNRGCFTERVHRRLERQGRMKGTPDSVASMTSRSERGDSVKLYRDSENASKSPRLALPRDPRALEDILDYFWVYQGMGRQVLDLDLAAADWERKMFRKCEQLPPIARSYDQQQALVLRSREKDAIEHGLSEDDPAETRVKSEPPILSRSYFMEREVQTFTRSKPKATRTYEETEDSVDRDRGTLPSNELNRQQGRLSLVVKMPVLTKDLTRSDTVFDRD